MADLSALADFPAAVCRVKTLMDNGIRVELDLPETEARMLSELHTIRLDGRILRVVLYDDDEFQRVLINRQKQENG